MFRRRPNRSESHRNPIEPLEPRRLLAAYTIEWVTGKTTLNVRYNDTEDKVEWRFDNTGDWCQTPATTSADDLTINGNGGGNTIVVETLQNLDDVVINGGYGDDSISIHRLDVGETHVNGYIPRGSMTEYGDVYDNVYGHDILQLGDGNLENDFIDQQIFFDGGDPMSENGLELGGNDQIAIDDGECDLDTTWEQNNDSITRTANDESQLQISWSLGGSETGSDSVYVLAGANDDEFTFDGTEDPHAGIVIHLEEGNDVVNLNGSDDKYIGLLIHDGGGDETYRFGANGMIPRGSVAVADGHGSDTLVFDDSAYDSEVRRLYELDTSERFIVGEYGESPDLDFNAQGMVKISQVLFRMQAEADVPPEMRVTGTIESHHHEVNYRIYPGEENDVIHVDNIHSETLFHIAPSEGLDVVTVGDTDGGHQADVIFDYDSEVDNFLPSIGSLTIEGNGTVTLDLDQGDALKMTELIIEDGGMFDVADCAAIIDYTSSSPESTVRGHLIDGFNGGEWNGPGGILSSNAADSYENRADPETYFYGVTAVGYAENDDLGFDTFGGQTVDETCVLIKYTYYADADLDGDVDTTDRLYWQANLGGAGAWSKGDWDYDGDIDNTDKISFWNKNLGMSGL